MFPQRIPPRIAALALALALPSLAFAGDEVEEGSKSGYLGVRMQRIEGGLAEALDLREDGGVLIGQVVEDSPADAAGIEEGDIVVKIDGSTVGTPDALREAVQAKSSGEKITLDVLRDGKPRKLTVTLGEASADSAMNDEGRRTVRWIERHSDRDDEDSDDSDSRDKHGWLGVVTQPLSGELGTYFGVEDGHGALVSEVVKDSPAAKLGLKAGDVITKVDGESIEGPADLMRAVREVDEAKSVEVVWTRDKRVRTGSATLEVREGWSGAPGPMREHLRSLRDLPRHFERRIAPPEMDGLSPRNRGGAEMDRLREELQALKDELKRLKEEIRGE